MFCKKCGSQLEPNSHFCSSCGSAVTDQPTGNDYGAPTYNQQQAAPQNFAQQSPSSQETNVCAILGFIFAFIFPIVGLVLSIIGRGKPQYRSLATAGMVISIIEIVIAVIAVIAIVATVNNAIDAASRYPYYYFVESLLSKLA